MVITMEIFLFGSIFCFLPVVFPLSSFEVAAENLPRIHAERPQECKLVGVFFCANQTFNPCRGVFPVPSTLCGQRFV